MSDTHRVMIRRLGVQNRWYVWCHESCGWVGQRAMCWSDVLSQAKQSPEQPVREVAFRVGLAAAAVCMALAAGACAGVALHTATVGLPGRRKS